MKRLQDHQLEIKAARNSAIRASIKRQLEENGYVDTDIVTQDLMEDEDYFEAVKKFTIKHTSLIEDAVQEEIDYDRAHQEAKQQTDRSLVSSEASQLQAKVG